MKCLCRTLFYLVVGVCVLQGRMTSGAEREPIEFQGRVTAVDLEAKTISVRARTKEFVFQIDTQRCNITKDGLFPSQPGAQSPELKSARVDDYAVGTLVLEGASPVVTRLCLTTKPELAVRVADKPGFVTSPYQSTSPANPAIVGGKAIDVRGYQRGSMLVDKDTGKIFLVP